MLLLLSVSKAICEILVFALLGQGVLWVVAGKSRQSSFVYRMFATVTRPVMWLSRKIMPRFVLDRHIWMVAVFIVLAGWIIAGQQKLKHCMSHGADSPLCVELLQALKERDAARN